MPQRWPQLNGVPKFSMDCRASMELELECELEAKAPCCLSCRSYKPLEVRKLLALLAAIQLLRSMPLVHSLRDGFQDTDLQAQGGTPEALKSSSFTSYATLEGLTDNEAGRDGDGGRDDELSKTLADSLLSNGLAESITRGNQTLVASVGDSPRPRPQADLPAGQWTAALVRSEFGEHAEPSELDQISSPLLNETENRYPLPTESSSIVPDLMGRQAGDLEPGFRANVSEARMPDRGELTNSTRPKSDDNPDSRQQPAQQMKRAKGGPRRRRKKRVSRP